MMTKDRNRLKSRVTAAVPTAKRKGRQDQPVGETLGMVLHAGVADRGRFHETRDLPRRGVDAHAQRPHAQLSVAQDGGGEGGVADAAGDRQAFSGDRFLIDRRAPLDDLPIDRDHFAGVDHDHVADG